VDSARNILSGVMFGEDKQAFIDSIVAAFAAALTALILAGVGFAKAIAGPAPFQWVGRMSYGAYLYHLPMVVIAGTLFPDPRPDQFDLWREAAVFATAYAATLVLASVSFRYFEQPILRLRSRFA
jgi:peptidoglycan/LPS O-acetylase OafA/YrhL